MALLDCMTSFITTIFLLVMVFESCENKDYAFLKNAVAENNEGILDHENDTEHPDIAALTLVPYGHPHYFHVDPTYAWGQAWIRKDPTDWNKDFKNLTERIPEFDREEFPDHFYLDRIAYNFFQFKKKWFGIGNLTKQERKDIYAFFNGPTPLDPDFPSVEDLEKYLIEVCTFKGIWKDPVNFRNVTIRRSIMNGFKKLKLFKLRDTEHPTFSDMEDTYHERMWINRNLSRFHHADLQARLIQLKYWARKEIKHPDYKREYPTFAETETFLKARHLYKGWWSLQNLTGESRKQLLSLVADRPLYKPGHEMPKCKATDDEHYPSEEHFRRTVLDLVYKDQLKHDPIGVRNFPILCPESRGKLMKFATDWRKILDNAQVTVLKFNDTMFPLRERKDDTILKNAQVDHIKLDNISYHVDELFENKGGNATENVKLTLVNLELISFPVRNKLFESKDFVVYEIPLHKAKELAFACDGHRSCRTFSKCDPSDVHGC